MHTDVSTESKVERARQKEQEHRAWLIANERIKREPSPIDPRAFQNYGAVDLESPEPNPVPPRARHEANTGVKRRSSRQPNPVPPKEPGPVQPKRFRAYSLAYDRNGNTVRVHRPEYDINHGDPGFDWAAANNKREETRPRQGQTDDKMAQRSIASGNDSDEEENPANLPNVP